MSQIRLLYDCMKNVDAGKTAFEIGDYFFFVRQFGPAKCLYGWIMSSPNVLNDIRCNMILSAVIAQDDMVYIPVSNVFDISEDDELREGYLHVRKALKYYCSMAQKKIETMTRKTYEELSNAPAPTKMNVRYMASEYILYDIKPEGNLPRFTLNEAKIFQILTGSLQMSKEIDRFIADNESKFHFLYPNIDEAYKLAESMKEDVMVKLYKKLEEEQIQTMMIILEKKGATASGKVNKSAFLAWLRNRIKMEGVKLTGTIFSNTENGRRVINSLGGTYYSSGMDFENILELKYRNSVLYHREETKEAKIA